MYTITDDNDALNIRASITSGSELEEFIAKLVVRASQKQWDLSGPELAKMAEKNNGCA